MIRSVCSGQGRSSQKTLIGRASVFSFSVREGRELIRSLTLEDPDSKAEVEAYAYNTVYKYEWS
jgi:hypothetical protein